MIIYIKMDLELNNLQWLICHKTQPNNKSSTESDISPYAWEKRGYHWQVNNHREMSSFW